MLWVLKRVVSVRLYFRATKIMFKIISTIKSKKKIVLNFFLGSVIFLMSNHAILYIPMLKQEGKVALKRSSEFCLKLTYRYL